MRVRAFGRTGWQVAEIGVGTWTMGGMWGAVDEAEAVRALRRALALGANFLDTAYVYGDGLSEQLIARALAGRAAPVYVATKVPPKNMAWPARHTTPARAAFPARWILDCTERSLKHLQRDAIDVQQLHVWAPRWLKESDVWLPAVARLKRAGKIRAFGLSVNDHEPDTALDAVASGLIDSVQVIYNVFEQTPAARLFAACQQHHVAVIARVPFDEGSLTGTFTPQTQFAPDDWRGAYFGGPRLAETVQRLERLRPLLEGPGRSCAQGALLFCLSHPAVSTVIPGMRRARHVEENVAVSRLPPWTAAELQRLKAHAWPRNFYQHCW